MEIHGYAAFNPSNSLSPYTFASKELLPYEILVKISHSGLCHTDLYMMENVWDRSTYPLVPGHEIVGTVIAKGDQAEKNIGQRVGLSWVRSSCLHCEQCLQGNTNICPTKIGIYTQGNFGGFADYIVADSRFAYLIPNALTSHDAAPLLCAGATVYAPLARFSTNTNHSIAIIGIGGLGHLGLQYAKKMGAKVSAISGTASKEFEAKQFGADHFYTLQDLPDPMQFDFILCTTDAALDWNKILELLKPNGSLCFVSRPPKGIQIHPKYFVSTQRSITSSNNANRSIMNEMLQFSAKHHIQPKIELMPLNKINEGIQKLKNNAVRYRIVFYIKD